MNFLFWASTIIVAYAFVGYAILMWLFAWLRPKHVIRGPIRPSVSILMAVHNGGEALLAKLKNLSTLNYPKEKLELIVVSDGSTDGTEEILSSAGGVKAIHCPRLGKSEALNHALAIASSEIVVFTDVRQRIEPDAIAELVSNFADEGVGCVSGELMFCAATTNKVAGISAYWKLEKLIRKCESASGSVIGATGALYAVRRSLIPRLPTGTLLDDVYVPLWVIRQGKRVIFEPKARAWDELSNGTASEFRRKVRTLAGNVQMLELAPWAIWNKAVRFRYVSHKLIRLVAPWLMIAMFFSAWALAGFKFYLVLAILQSLFYGIAAISALLPVLKRCSLATAAQAFCLMNAAAAIAPLTYLRYKSDPTRRWVSLKGNSAITNLRGISRTVSLRG
jgi:cellulose synthase/poly-beta-1,6-N-acetylglucosamine synthase-like glycosyltransferase